MINKEEIEAIEEAKKQIEKHHNWNNINCFMTDTTTLKKLVNLIEKQENRIKELEEINEEHQKLNGDLQKKVTQLEIENNNLLKIQETKGVYVTREVAPYIKKLNELEIKTDNLICENKKLQEIIDGKVIQELGTSDLYKEDN